MASWFTKAYRIPQKRWQMLKDTCHSFEVIKETRSKKGNVIVEVEVLKEDAYGRLRANRVLVNKDWM